MLRFTLEHPLLLALFSVVLIGGAYLCYQHTGSDLLPEMDEGGFIVDYIMPAGSSLEETNRVITPRGADPARHSRSGKHLAPHRPATRPRRGHRGQHRRYLPSS